MERREQALENLAPAKDSQGTNYLPLPAVEYHVEVRRHVRLPRQCEQHSQLQLAPFHQNIRGTRLIMKRSFYQRHQDLLSLSYRMHVQVLEDEAYEEEFNPEHSWNYGSLFETMNRDYHRLYDYQASHHLDDGWGRVLVPHAMLLGVLEALQKHGQLDPLSRGEVTSSSWYTLLEEEIAAKGGRAFVKTPFISAVHDATARPATSAMDALLLLASSRSVIRAVREYGLPHSVYLVVLPWEDGIKDWNQFRVFVQDRQPVAICPEHWWIAQRLDHRQCYRLCRSLLSEVQRFLERSLLVDSVVSLWVENLDHPDSNWLQAEKGTGEHGVEAAPDSPGSRALHQPVYVLDDEIDHDVGTRTSSVQRTSSAGQRQHQKQLPPASCARDETGSTDRPSLRNANECSEGGEDLGCPARFTLSNQEDQIPEKQNDNEGQVARKGERGEEEYRKEGQKKEEDDEDHGFVSVDWSDATPTNVKKKTTPSRCLSYGKKEEPPLPPLRAHICEVKPGGRWSHVSSGIFCWTDDEVFVPFGRVVFAYLVETEASRIEKAIVQDDINLLQRSQMVNEGPRQLTMPQVPLFEVREGHAWSDQDDPDAPASPSAPSPGNMPSKWNDCAGSNEHEWIQVNSYPLLLADNIFYEISHMDISLDPLPRDPKAPGNAKNRPTRPPRDKVTSSDTPTSTEKHPNTPLYPCPQASGGSATSTPWQTPCITVPSSVRLSGSHEARMGHRPLAYLSGPGCPYLIGNYWPRSLKARLENGTYEVQSTRKSGPG